MGLGPITYAEIEAYRRLTLDDLTSWEIILIRRLDDAVRGVIAAKAPKRQPNGQPEPEGIPVNDVGAIRGLFANLKARKTPRSDT